MGKSKKGQRGRKDDDTEGDIPAEIDLLKEVGEETKEPAESMKQRQKQKRKDKKKQKEEKIDDDEDDEIDDIAAFAKKAARPASKTKDMVSAFQMLAMDDMSEEEESAEENTDKDKGGKKTTKKQDSVEDEGFDFEPSELKQKQKKNKKEKKKKTMKQEEEDLDALIAQFDTPNEPKQTKKDKKKKGQETSVETDIAIEEKPAENVPKKEENPFDFRDLSSMTQEEIAKALGDDDDEEEDDRRKKRKEKKKATKEKEESEEGEEAEEGSAEGLITIKTAAQKKKEKKERQKQQKLQEKTKQKKKTDQEEESQADQTAVASTHDLKKPDEAETTKDTETAGAESKDVADEEPTEEDDGKKKKKDRKKKKNGEKDKEEATTKKKPSKMVKAMQEQLKLIKEEEERMQKEEEEKQRKLEEAIRLKEEQERLAKEKKERLKQKQKEKIERAKAEGRYLTPKQKEQQRRAQQMLEAMKAQGIAIPQKQEGETRKRVVYRKAPKKKTPSQDEAPTSPVIEESKMEESVDEKESEVAKEEAAPEGPEVKDSWDAESEDDVKDAWDEDSEEEEDAKPDSPKEAETVKKPAVSKKEDDQSEDSDDSEEDSDDDSDEEESEESSDEESEEEDDMTYAEKIRERAKARIQARREQALKNKDPNVLRAPVVCVLGHVDTGKTKILDKLRKTNVQDGEAGGITQQIGATNVPRETIRVQTQICKEFSKQELKLPGLLIIDTPGHESFSNLRSRGSSLCDIAILVVDIMHGLEPQTIESLNLLKKRKTPFIVALNKVDRLYQWQSNPHNDVTNTLKKQKPNTKVEFDERVKSTIVQFAEQGLNAALFYENKNPREYISMVPTSAHSGDGMANLVALICDLSQKFLSSSIAFSEELQATVMEVKAIPGLGTTIDVILVNGRIRESDTIVVAGTEGPIVTQVRGVLTPQPLKELRVKGSFIHHKEIMAAQGVKLIGKDLEKALAGLPLHVAEHPDEVDLFKEDVASALKAVLASIQIQDRGVFVQASTLGSLEALLEYLRTSKIPYAGINIGPVHKREVMKASVMLEHDTQLAVILAFDVKVEREAQELADSLGVKIFTADIIYHLFDSFMAFRDNIKKQKQAEFKNIAVFPCKVRVLPQYIFNSRDPLVMGVVIEGGFIKVGMPICVPSQEFLDLGRVTSLEVNHKSVEKVTKGQEVCIKIEAIPGEAPKMFGRHFDHTDLLMSKISRDSIDAVKNWFREEMTKADWQLMIELKKLFEIL